jgi:hypothetical protein
LIIDREVPAMPKRSPGSSVKDPEQYEALRDKGMSKEKAARISNTSAKSGRSTTGRRGGRSGSYDDRSKEDLLGQARKVGIAGRSKMSKSELISALRNH